MPAEMSPPKIGKNIASLRKKRNMSLDALSELSGVSKSMLFQIEQDKANPSLATVWKIARGLNVDFRGILSGEAEEGGHFDIVRKPDASVLLSDDGKCRLRVVTNVHLLDSVVGYYLEMKPRGALISKPHFPGSEEILFVLKGSVTVKSGQNEAELHRGDSIRYASDLEHSVENRTNSEAEAYLIVHNKNWEQALKKQMPWPWQ